MGGGSKSGGRAPRILLPPSGSLLMTSSPSWITASPPALGSDHRTARYPPSRGAPREGGFTPGEFSNGESGEHHSGNDSILVPCWIRSSSCSGSDSERIFSTSTSNCGLEAPLFQFPLLPVPYHFFQYSAGVFTVAGLPLIPIS